jgi:hypothetical protein
MTIIDRLGREVSSTPSVTDDTTELTGDLDTNGFNIGFDDGTGITDDAGNEQLIFRKTASAVNYVTVTNAATGNKPQIAAAGDDTNVGLKIAPKGAGVLEFGGTQGWGFGTPTVNLAGWGGFDNVLTVYNPTAHERSIVEIGSNCNSVGDTVAALAITNTANTGVGAAKLSFLIQWNARNYGGGGTNDWASDMTFTAYEPATDTYRQVLTIGSTDGVGCVLIDTEGPHGINADQNVDAMIYIAGNATKATGASFGAAEIMRMATQTNMPVGMGGRGLVVAARFVKALSGLHTIAGILAVPPQIVANPGGGTAVVSQAVTLQVSGAPTGSSDNLALLISGGRSRTHDAFQFVPFANPTPSDGDIWLASNTDTGLKVRINGVTKTVGLDVAASGNDTTSVSNVQTASYQAVLTDAGKTIRMNVAGANNLTIPANATVAFPVDSFFNIEQYGAGQTTIVAAGGVTIRSRIGLKMGGQYAVATLHKIATDEWILGGDVSA